MKRSFFDNLYVNSELKLVAFRFKRFVDGAVKGIRTTPEMRKRFREEIVPYWKQYGIRPDINYQKYYSMGDVNKFNKRFIQNDLWVTKIVPHYNSLLYAQGFQDKCLHNLFFPGVKRPETLVKNVNGIFYDDQLRLLKKEEAVRILLEYGGRFIVKPSVGSSQGRGIRFYNSDELTEESVEEIFDRYHRKNFVIQKLLRQHPDIARLHDKSVNTIRVITFLFRDEVQILSTIIRIGNGQNEVDNVAAGGFQVNINPDGTLQKTAYTSRNGKHSFTETNGSGVTFEGYRLPSFDRVIETVKRMASSLGHFRIVGWDMAVDESGDPVFIEFNCNPGQNQMTYGPTLKEFTDDVLDEVFGRNGK